MFQKYIMEHPSDGSPIDGLGNNELSIGYYEWFIPTWYQDGVKSGLYYGTVYDMLSLSFLGSKSKEEIIEKGIKWYRNVLGLHPNSHQLRIGLANILSNKTIYEEAIQEYEQVQSMMPTWTRPLECIAYLY